MTDDHTRRHVLRTAAVGGIGLALAGCLGGNSSGTKTAADDDSGGAGGGGADTTAGDDSKESGGSSGSSDADVTIEVGPGGQFKYKPENPTVKKGETVEWVWKSNQHNIVVSSQPDGAGWEGTEGGESKLFDEGYRYTHTFETAGTYEYYCSPHKSVGMEAKVTVE
ncbi:plastocyanin/azurin family copper-binding protein [Haloarchaeobius sp. HME9146]|uniref:plastocyanin/azurin family copper-binding protein n=1 Tax=Haloarchaeobius sp. HME9146 TaxID=2978732 RepID=UPI0021C13823|nr:plastocyanin/azurin family copper-binding protein [Haloarchaeobius sp. HME9146]MCT9095568.1 plastocyanin/azurin family copper-binding protein [Haloarchaeobius sp. HME9146]